MEGWNGAKSAAASPYRGLFTLNRLQPQVGAYYHTLIFIVQIEKDPQNIQIMAPKTAWSVTDDTIDDDKTSPAT